MDWAGVVLAGKGGPQAGLMLVTLALFLGAAPLASAHGTPEKVVGDVVVSLIPVPVHDAMALRFFFRDLQSGQLLRVPVTFRARLRQEPAGTQSEDGPRLTTTTGQGEFVPQASFTGPYEVWLEFERADRPGTTYRPDDWLIEIGGPATARRMSAAWMFAAAVVVLVGVLGWRRRWA